MNFNIFIWEVIFLSLQSPLQFPIRCFIFCGLQIIALAILFSSWNPSTLQQFWVNPYFSYKNYYISCESYYYFLFIFKDRSIHVILVMLLLFFSLNLQQCFSCYFVVLPFDFFCSKSLQICSWLTEKHDEPMFCNEFPSMVTIFLTSPESISEVCACPWKIPQRPLKLNVNFF